jgi:hypothetical protein
MEIRRTSDWTVISLGIWVLSSPWILGFSAFTVLKWSNVIAGAVLVLLSVWNLFGPIAHPVGDTAVSGRK